MQADGKINRNSTVSQSAEIDYTSYTDTNDCALMVDALTDTGHDHS